MREVETAILEYVNGLSIVDTHEHLPHQEDARRQDADVLSEYLTHYFSRDLISAGLSQQDFDKVVDVTRPLADRWRLVEPYWQAACNTGYGRCLEISARDLYGITPICGDTIEALNEAFRKGIAPGHYRRVLKEESGIRISLLDNHLGCDREFFRSVYRLDEFVYPRSHTEVAGIEQRTGMTIRSFNDWLEACEADLQQALERGAVALKCGLAYVRSLHFARATYQDAEEEFNAFIAGSRGPDWQPKPIEASPRFQDYMMHYILRLAGKSNLTFQFHTGLQEGNGNLIANSDPTLLSNVFLEYPDVDFDVFHIGYPYQQVVSVLAKTFPNVFIDMCWAHIISPVASIQALVEWLDSVPANKISAFGGDYCFVDGVYGHQFLARRNVSRALAMKVDADDMDLDRACQIAEMLFVSNPLRIFKLDSAL
ncbi:MAG: amidohydrolase family protein [bacterium]|nr:amidohydrolase family protein [bacterium]